MHVSISKG